MILKPASRDDLSAQLAEASTAGRKFTGADLTALAALVQHHPEDMTATVEAGLTLAEFQKRLCPSGQWLPLDPPSVYSLSIGDLLAHDRFGPRRLGYGRARDYLIGVKVALADGTLIKAGGNVVKNVAGYDLCKLFIGARHTLGIICEATFKLLPLPEKEAFVRARAGSLDELEACRKRLLASPVEPVLFDAHNLEGAITLVAAFAGSNEDVVAQVEIARAAGFEPAMNETNYMERFHRGDPAQTLSVLPSQITEAIRKAGGDQWIAHLGFGHLRYRGGKAFKMETNSVLETRLKDAYDPKRILELINDGAA